MTMSTMSGPGMSTPVSMTSVGGKTMSIVSPASAASIATMSLASVAASTVLSRDTSAAESARASRRSVCRLFHGMLHAVTSGAKSTRRA
jgi:hypothetical protein